MKKITPLVIMTVCILNILSAQKESFTKELAEKYRKIEKNIQLSVTGETILITPKADTVISYTKKGRPVETVTDKTKTRVIRTDEKGVITKREGDIIYVTFDEKKKTEMTLPFKLSGPGKDNQYVLNCDESFGGGSSSEITINGITYQVSNPEVGLEVLSLKSNLKNETQKIVSKGAHVKN